MCQNVRPEDSPLIDPGLATRVALVTGANQGIGAPPLGPGAAAAPAPGSAGSGHRGESPLPRPGQTGPRTARRAPLLVLVGGAPGAGKTTLAFRLGAALQLPVLSRDAIKDGLAEPLGIADPVLGRSLAGPTFALFYDTIGRFLDAGCSLVAEHAFWRGRSEPDLIPLVARARSVFVHCRLPRDVHLLRCAARLAGRGGPRHGSHPDAAVLAQMRAGTFPWTDFDPPDLGIPTVAVDTTAAYVPGLDALADAIRAV